ncbi:flagellar FlbD family protein [Sedimentibacter sp. zth1]|uniref:flagellar FlbD family protein n=1 Tax=Sedimentibacter sp. zth1 TaxID=2816908 RepID=UPI001A910207|nr:flagellar FlbD family protein [Sedimentibacter sp. zth1]QSX07194.1 flagellar FlbD family protein [Sedimentibacter sp. zth1]
MIVLQKLNKEEIVLNSNLIELIETIPETKIMLTTGRYYLVTQTKDEVVNRIIEYNRKIYSNLMKVSEV